MQSIKTRWKDLALIFLTLFLLTDEGYVEKRLHNELTQMIDIK